jgi:hypothetical protein
MNGRIVIRCYARKFMFIYLFCESKMTQAGRGKVIA